MAFCLFGFNLESKQTIQYSITRISDFLFKNFLKFIFERERETGREEERKRGRQVERGGGGGKAGGGKKGEGGEGGAGGEGEGDRIQSRLQTLSCQQSPTRGSNSRTLRSRSELKSDAQMTEPPGARRISDLLLILGVHNTYMPAFDLSKQLFFFF